jgi:hypothetical protein
MKNQAIVPYTIENRLNFLTALKESILHSNLKYSSVDLQLILEISDYEIDNALSNAIAICHLAGIESSFHFKQIFVFDIDFNTINIHWKMSKKGFNLVVMQLQKRNQKNAVWLWQLTDN